MSEVCGGWPLRFSVPTHPPDPRPLIIVSKYREKKPHMACFPPYVAFFYAKCSFFLSGAWVPPTNAPSLFCAFLADCIVLAYERCVPALLLFCLLRPSAFWIDWLPTLTRPMPVLLLFWRVFVVVVVSLPTSSFLFFLSFLN